MPAPTTVWCACVRRRWLRLTLTVLFPLVLVGAARAEGTPPFLLQRANLERLADGALTLMSYSVVPDLAGSLLSVKDGSTQNPGVRATQFGAGSVMGTSFPLYLEGFLGLSRYDPKFVFSNGLESRTVPARWNTVAGTAGIGWAFPFFLRDLTLVPVFNFSLGHVESDSSLLGRAIEYYTGKGVDFLRSGRLNSFGLGGSLMLSYMRYREFYDLDVQLRYTNIALRSFDTRGDIDGNAEASSVSFYSRLRGPTGVVLLRRPLRYVAELSNTNYVGDQRGVLGFNFLSSAGVGLEIDTSAVHTVIGRVRYVFRYFFGENVSGYGGSIAISF